ncbi:MAG: TetR/AcrR family transcriptional regulator [Parvibaculum sp.]|nr:TetR/AcrR family transcriptional regulator [Parvibaculum sp.]
MPKIIDHKARRHDIAKAAVSVIGEIGIENTRLIDVAREAKATTGTITHYFEGKDALLLAALDHVAQRILRLMHKSSTTRNRDDLIDTASLTLPVDDEGKRDWRVWLAFFSRAVGDPALARINNAYYDEIKQGISKIIRTLQKSGEICMSVDPDEAADSVITVADGLGVRASLDPENWPAEKIKRQMSAMLRPLLPKP